ncbi:MAG: MTH938/NDUFAF3 family protein [Thermodesulfobacteriota bacterium]|nr:MTH938/NDUFAF3 family protein [Thermodesulfobacteriota bacterium]
MKIESYRFGEIVINGIHYTKDLKIIRGKTFDNWWRSQGHTLQLSDVLDVVAAKPGTLIVGTGAYGRMVLSSGLSEELASKGIRTEALPTELAIQRFKELASQPGHEETVALAVHLTC